MKVCFAYGLTPFSSSFSRAWQRKVLTWKFSACHRTGQNSIIRRHPLNELGWLRRPCLFIGQPGGLFLSLSGDLTMTTWQGSVDAFCQHTQQHCHDKQTCSNGHDIS